MPTYEYACRSCGEHLEIVQSFRDDALTTCPNCEGQLRKVFSAAGIIFKGSGWHSKDYADKRGGAPARAADSDKDSAADSSGDSSSSSADSASSTETSSGDKPSGDKPSGDKASGDKASGDKSSSTTSGGSNAESA